MISDNNNGHKRWIAVCILILPAFCSYAQTVGDNSLFWKVTGKNLKDPSYLFGTFHLMGSEYVDSLTVVMDAFGKAKTLAGEMVLDESLSMRLMQEAIMRDTTLHDLLTDDVYESTASWLKELTGMDLGMLNKFNPSMIQMLITAMAQQKIGGKATTPMDLYFQNLAKADKKVEGLETFEDQINVLFRNTSYRAQANHLAEFVSKRDSSEYMILKMNKMYRDQDLEGLMDMFFKSNYSTAEGDALLDSRNKKWMERLPELFAEQSTFVAVGALHLPGKNGLVSLLRGQGYTVEPLNMGKRR